MKIYLVIGGKWFDKQNGNTYNRAKILDIKTEDRYYTNYTYGYGTQYLTEAEIYIRNTLKKKSFKIINGGSYYMTKRELKSNYF